MKFDPSEKRMLRMILNWNFRARLLDEKCSRIYILSMSVTSIGIALGHWMQPVLYFVKDPI